METQKKVLKLLLDKAKQELNQNKNLYLFNIPLSEIMVTDIKELKKELSDLIDCSVSYTIVGSDKSKSFECFQLVSCVSISNGVLTYELTTPVIKDLICSSNTTKLIELWLN